MNKRMFVSDLVIIWVSAIAVNSTVIYSPMNVFEPIVSGFAVALAFSLIHLFFSAMRERIAVSDVPGPLKGPAIELVTVVLISIAFLGAILGASTSI